MSFDYLITRFIFLFCLAMTSVSLWLTCMEIVEGTAVHAAQGWCITSLLAILSLYARYMAQEVRERLHVHYIS